MAYVATLRMHRAAYLLADENLRISEIGAMVGYDDLYYFSRCFKKHYGLSPRAMRRRMQHPNGAAGKSDPTRQ